MLGWFRRIYHQRCDNYIYELSYNHTAGWDLNARKLFEALPGTHMTAIVFLTGNNSPEIRLYYFNPKGVLSEYRYSGENWGTGSNIPAPDWATNCRLNAFTFDDRPEIRVYYQTRDNILAEACYTVGGWKAGVRFAWRESMLLRAWVKLSVLRKNEKWLRTVAINPCSRKYRSFTDNK